MAASAASSLAVIFFTFSPAMAASASSLAFFFSFLSVMPASNLSRVFSAAAFCGVFNVGGDADEGAGESALQATVSVRVPALHDLLPETV